MSQTEKYIFEPLKKKNNEEKRNPEGKLNASHRRKKRKATKTIGPGKGKGLLISDVGMHDESLDPRIEQSDDSGSADENCENLAITVVGSAVCGYDMADIDNHEAHDDDSDDQASPTHSHTLTPPRAPG